MQADFVDQNMVNSDLGVVNMARVSLAKHHETFVEPDDTKLIYYLARNNHITPFFHSRIYLNFPFLPGDRLYFYENANLSGFSWIMGNPGSFHGSNYYLRGSLYGFCTQSIWLPYSPFYALEQYVKRAYPVSYLEWWSHERQGDNIFGASVLDEGVIAEKCLEDPEFYKLLSATLRVKIPLFVARQIRTSKVGFVYSELFVESEAFDYNESSRRYVNDDPEFYEIKEWRVREGTQVKQGSTGIAQYEPSSIMKMYEEDIIDKAKCIYDHANKMSIAPEQARVLLPQDMYVEWYQTGTLHRWAQFLKLRLDPHVQPETRDIAVSIRDVLASKYPEWCIHYAL